MGELQTTQAHLNALKEENRELSQENQQLRQEIEKIINSVMHLQQVTGTSYQPMSPSQMPPSISQPVQMPKSPPVSDRTPQSTTNPNNESSSLPFVSPFATGQPGGLSDDPEPLFTEQQEPRPRRVTRSPQSSELGGVWLFISIFLIVVSAFGIGFFFIRPFMQQNQTEG